MSKVEWLKKVINRTPTVDELLNLYRSGEVRLFDKLGNLIISETKLLSIDPQTVQVEIKESSVQLTGQSSETVGCGVCNNNMMDAKLMKNESIYYCAKCHHTDWPSTRVKSNEGPKRKEVSLNCQNGMCRLVEG